MAPKINILVIGVSISNPTKSDKNPGIRRKKPPIGLNNVLSKLSAVGSKLSVFDLIFNILLKPGF